MCVRVLLYWVVFCLARPRSFAYSLEKLFGPCIRKKYRTVGVQDKKKQHNTTTHKHKHTYTLRWQLRRVSRQTRRPAPETRKTRVPNGLSCLITDVFVFELVFLFVLGCLLLSCTPKDAQNTQDECVRQRGMKDKQNHWWLCCHFPGVFVLSCGCAQYTRPVSKTKSLNDWRETLLDLALSYCCTMWFCLCLFCFVLN